MPRIWLLVAVLALVSVDTAFGQHHGGQTAPPISFGDKKVSVATSIEPIDFIPGKNPTANLKVRFFDSQTDANIDKVTYRVQIFSGFNLLASQMFYDKDGELDILVQPNSACAEKELWRCTQYEGDKDPAVPSAFTSSGANPPVIRGPVFDKSGLYTIKVAIIGATNPRTQTAEDINFESQINIAQEQAFTINSSTGQAPVTVKTFQEPISNLKFNEQTKSISFEAPFQWSHAEHISFVRNDIEIPKSFTPLQSVNSFRGSVNGHAVFAKNVHFDSYSSKETNTIHFLVAGDELKQIGQKIDTTQNTMLVEIIPDASDAVKSTDVLFSNGYKASISYDTRYDGSKGIVFTIGFFDSSANLAKDIRYAYGIQDSNGDEFVVNVGNNPNFLGNAVPSGVDSRLIAIPSAGTYTMKIVLIGRGFIDFNPFVSQSMQFNVSEQPITEITPSKVLPNQQQIPSWVKNNAKWWADGTIGDTDFVQGIQFLIKQGIVKVN